MSIQLKLTSRIVILRLVYHAPSKESMWGVNFDFKVTMNKLWGRLFIIIFIDVYRQSKYIPTVTNFASILANCFYFLRKVNTSTSFHTKFLRSTRQVLPKKLWTNSQKTALLVAVYEERYSNFMQRPHFERCLKIAIDSTLNACVRRLVAKNGEFKGVSLTQKGLREGFVLDGVDYKLLELL